MRAFFGALYPHALRAQGRLWSVPYDSVIRHEGIIKQDLQPEVICGSYKKWCAQIRSAPYKDQLCAEVRDRSGPYKDQLRAQGRLRSLISMSTVPFLLSPVSIMPYACGQRSTCRRILRLIWRSACRRRDPPGFRSASGWGHLLLELAVKLPQT